MNLKNNNMNLESIKKMSRKDIIKWLICNDPNGIYSDKESKAEFGKKMSKSKGIKIIFRQSNGN